MDLILDACDKYFLSPFVYPQSWPEDYPLRQFISLFLITGVGGWLLYFITACFSYYFMFDHKYMLHPQFLKNQVRLEITYTTKSVPFLSLLTAVVFVLEVQGYSKLYDSLDENSFFSSWLFIAISVVAFIMFTDCFIYWIHRGLHHPWVYKHCHKGHHKWKVPTPFASHAFHPIDGFLQSFPYHVYPFLFPLHKGVYLVLFVAVNIWTVSIHDGDYKVPKILEPFINGSAHHTDHHLLYKYNYGQFFTLWDKLAGSYQHPTCLQENTLRKEIKPFKEKQS